MATQTLLVGLGGTGCEIVSRVKKLIDARDPNVQFVGFDTDGDWEGTDGLPVIYTSRNMKVSQYLKYTKGWEEWFPDNAILKNRTMIKGAGQIRALSRLAFTETLSSGRIGELKDAIRKLQTSRGEIKPSNFRIMIISSFAGGTGSGMYLQTALFLREYIRKEYGDDVSVIIRGLFAMPDIFVSGNSSAKQKNSMYANAYAALRELNAINLVCLSKDPAADAIRMQIDNLFDSKRDRMDASKKPFDFIFFVDNLNERSEVKEEIEDYKQLLTTVAYMQVYSPITEAGDSREDNAIFSIMEGGGKPLYGGVGASRIVYPYQELVDYCGTRATIEAIGDSWTLIDREFAKASEENKRQMRIDATVKKLNRRDFYVTTVESMLEEGNARLGFINRALKAMTPDGSAIDRVQSYYEYLYNFVLNKIRSDEEISIKEADVGVTEAQLKANLSNNVTRNETALKEYMETINDQIALLRNSAVQGIIPDDLTSALNTDNDWNLTKLLTLDGKVVHPLSLRMLLYKLREMISQELSLERGVSAAKYKQINEYFKNAYDIKGTQEVESAASRANQGGLFKKAQFRAEYLRKSTAQKGMLDSYRDAKMVSVVFEDVLKRLDFLIEQYEKLFDSLEDIRAELQKKVDTFEEYAHTRDTEPAVYLGCKPEEKRALYDSLNFNCSDDDENDVYGTIFYSLYDAANKALVEAKKKAAVKLSAKEQLEERNQRMGQVFRESVLKKNIADVAASCTDKLDLDVFAAMEKYNGNGSMHDCVARTFEKAKPCLKTETNGPIVSLLSASGSEDSNYAYTMTFWGINPEVEEKISTQSGMKLKEFFTAGEKKETPEVVSDEEYSRYEISCYQALYCVRLNEIPKFLETGRTPGVYYENYETRIKAILENDQELPTPHLDMRWHSRNYLPMISDEKNAEDDKRTARALWLALIYGGLPEASEDGKKVLYAAFLKDTEGGGLREELMPSRDIQYAGKSLQIKNVYELYKALQIDEITTQGFITAYEPALQADMETGLENMEFVGPRARTFAKKLVSKTNPDRNALNVLARFLSHAKVTKKEQELFIKALEELIAEFCSQVTDKRQATLRELIYKASRFTTSANRAKIDRYINLSYWSGKKEEE